MSDFRSSAPSAETVFLRTYSRRKADGSRENFEEAMLRTVDDIAEIGQYTKEEYELVKKQALAQHAFPSGRAFWVAGTEWGKKPENFSGYYNCTSTHMSDLEAFGLMIDLAMQGSGTGAVLEEEVVRKLPKVRRELVLRSITPIANKVDGNPKTTFTADNEGMIIVVGDSRQGWKNAYMLLLQAATSAYQAGPYDVWINLEEVRPAGKKLKGFGGTANPVKLEQMFRKVIDLLNGAVGRKLSTVEACLLIDEAATCIVAGNIRRSAGMRQFSQFDEEATVAKDGLYKQDEEGNWVVDTKKEALRMANHTRCFHEKPTYETIEEAVRKQFYSGEGAIQYVPEAVARANADILSDANRKAKFVETYSRFGREKAKELLNVWTKNELDSRELQHRVDRYGLNPCGEIIGRDFHCNLAEVHLNTMDPSDASAQDAAFYAAGLQVAALLQHEFVHERYQYSRSIDPIVGVSFTGLFDFLVHALGSEWLDWMMAGRPEDGRRAKLFRGAETAFLKRWRLSAHKGVKAYCAKHGLRTPNRITTVQPAGTKSLLTGASSGWHPPKAQRFIRRITLGKTDPLVPALIEYGFSVIPAQSARDEEGKLLDDINDERVQEVLVEIPTAVSWADLPGCDEHDMNQLPIEAQWGLYMNVQQNYTDHNTSATLEIREHEIPVLAKLIHESIQNGTGYISAAILARFDANETFPRLPFEPISKETYEGLQGILEVIREGDDRTLLDILEKYDSSEWNLESVSSCTSAACIAKADKEERNGQG